MLSSVKAYSFAAVLVAAAFFLNLGVRPIVVTTPLAVFFWAVIISAWFFGTGPGVFAMLVSAAVANYYLFPPFHHLSDASADIARVIFFFATCILIMLLIDGEKSQRKKVTSILDGMSDAFVVYDRHWICIRANRSARELLGKDPVGSILWDAAPETKESVVWDSLHTAMRARIPLSYEHYYAPLKVWLQADCFPTDEGVSVFLRNVTQRKQAEQSLKASEARYRFLAESMSQYVWTSDEYGNVDYVNQHFLEFTGLTMQDIQANRTMDVIHPDDRARVGAIAMESLRTGAAYEIEYRARRKLDGTYRWFLARCERFTDSEGKLKWLGIGIDITERKKAADIINENRQQMRMVLDAAHVGAWVWDLNTDDVVDLGNTSDIFGVPSLNSFEVFKNCVAPDDQEHVRQSIATAVQSGRYDAEFRIVRPDGEIRWLRAIGSVVRDDDGRPLQMAGVNFDITEKKRIEQALLKSEKLAAVGRLAASVSHEINNPLEAVTNLLFLIERETDTEMLRDYIKTAQQELARVTEIAKQTLRFNRQPSQRSKVSAGELTDSVLMLFRGRISQVGVEVKTEYAANDTFLCYASEVRQVIANLVSNALDASVPGGKLRIRTKMVNSAHLGRCIRVTVADTGRGMNTATQKLIYEPFFTTKESTGTGLGLWVSLEIARKHGGVIRVRSSSKPENHGTVFTVLFPAGNGAAASSSAAD